MIVKNNKLTKCRARGCREIIKPGLILCGTHWFFLPTSQRVEGIRALKSCSVERDRFVYRAIAEVNRMIGPKNRVMKTEKFE